MNTLIEQPALPFELAIAGNHRIVVDADYLARTGGRKAVALGSYHMLHDFLDDRDLYDRLVFGYTPDELPRLGTPNGPRREIVLASRDDLIALRKWFLANMTRSLEMEAEGDEEARAAVIDLYLEEYAGPINQALGLSLDDTNPTSADPSAEQLNQAALDALFGTVKKPTA